MGIHLNTLEFNWARPWFQRQVQDSQTLIINHLSALTARLGAIEVRSHA